MHTNEKEYKEIVREILENNAFKKTINITHHGISRYEHLNKIAYHAYKIAKKFNWDYVSVARGALLHDFYLDGNERDALRKFTDTFTHPKKALETSAKYFNINDMEKNIIISHMFPTYLSLPKYKESILVNIVDKIIGFHEMTREYRYKFKYYLNYLFILVLVIISK